MPMILSKLNVLEAARERIRWCFQEFETVVVGVSGGKDSTVLFHLTLDIARELGRLPLPIIWVDQEAEWSSTVALTREWMQTPGVKPYWMQIPFKMENATSYLEHRHVIWDPATPEKWLREKDPIAIKENTYGVDTWEGATVPIDKILAQEFRGQRFVHLGGVRVEESFNRRLGLTSYACYKWVTWGAKRKTHVTLHPLYDWTYRDIWKAIHDHGWRYNEIYDFQYRHGIPVTKMRVSSLHHETAVWQLFYLQEIDVALYDRMVQRMPGIDMAGKFGLQFFAKQLPAMFATWQGYRDHLKRKLVTDSAWLKGMDGLQAQYEKAFQGSRERLEALARVQCQSILAADTSLTKMRDFFVTGVNHYDRSMLAKELEAAPWKFSVRFAKVAPHWYILKKQAPELYEKVALRIKMNGRDLPFCLGGRFIRETRYWFFNGYKYWICGGDVLNRDEWTRDYTDPKGPVIRRVVEDVGSGNE